VASTRQHGHLRLIFRSKNKNDRNDAERLAKLLYLGETPTVHVPTQEVRTWRELITCRGQLIAKRTQAKNTLRSLLRSAGVVPPKHPSLWTKSGLKWLRQLELPTFSQQLKRDLLLEEIETLVRQVRRIEQELNRQARRTSAVEQLRTIPGVGPRTADAVAHPVGARPMRPTRPPSFRDHADHLRRHFLQDGRLPFTDVLTEDVLAEALAFAGRWLDRIFSPLVTLWVFLGQVLDPDHSCRAAVARLNAHRVAHGRRPCSARTGAYCRARQRLPEGFFAATACAVGRRLDERARPEWRWKGRRVYLFDGTVVSMPDTPANQAACGARRRRWSARRSGRTVLAYNLIRTVMAQAAARHEIPPRSISFTGAMQTLEAFEPLLAQGPARDAAGRRDLYHEVLDAIATHRVADRPDRFEPRLKKRRKDYCGWFTEPRAEVKRRMAKGTYEK
jgi:hypothetical protein